MKNRHIYFMERNLRGAWVVFGVLGIRQYYYYTQKETRELYMNEVKKTLAFNQSI